MQYEINNGQMAYIAVTMAQQNTEQSSYCSTREHNSNAVSHSDMARLIGEGLDEAMVVGKNKRNNNNRALALARNEVCMRILRT